MICWTCLIIKIWIILIYKCFIKLLRFTWYNNFIELWAHIFRQTVLLWITLVSNNCILFQELTVSLITLIFLLHHTMTIKSNLLVIELLVLVMVKKWLFKVSKLFLHLINMLRQASFKTKWSKDEDIVLHMIQIEI